jgi:hypothetical protein
VEVFEPDIPVVTSKHTGGIGFETDDPISILLLDTDLSAREEVRTIVAAVTGHGNKIVIKLEKVDPFAGVRAVAGPTDPGLVALGIIAGRHAMLIDEILEGAAAIVVILPEDRTGMHTDVKP